MLTSPHILTMYQKNLKRKYDEIETYYYESVDELYKKIEDLDLPDIPAMPDFSLTQYVFVTDWEKGLLSSEEVDEIFKYMDLESAAKAKLTKRLVNFMVHNEIICDYFKPSIAKIEADCLERMVKYLEVLKRFFSKVAATDQMQIPIVWLEQSLDSGEISTSLEEMPLNQAIRQLDTFIIGNVEQKFFFDKNVVVFDEFDEDRRIIHWLFAQETHVDLLKLIFQVKEVLSGQDEKDYLKTILASHR